MKFSAFNITILIMALAIFACKQGEKQPSKEVLQPQVELTGNSLLDTIQHQTINYFWEGAEPNSGLARERLHLDDDYSLSPKQTVTIGGSGFGVMAILVGIERGFINKEEALDRFLKNVAFLEKADRFHGAWPHLLDVETGKVLAFSKKDDGGDLVETAFLIQGLLTVAEYFDGDTEKEKQLIERYNKLADGIAAIEREFTELEKKKQGEK